MTDEIVSPEASQTRLQTLQDELQRLRQEERQVKEQIARLQAEVSRSRRRDRRRAQIARSAAIPSLQMQRRRLGADILRLEQELRVLRDQMEQGE